MHHYIQVETLNKVPRISHYGIKASEYVGPTSLVSGLFLSHIFYFILGNNGLKDRIMSHVWKKKEKENRLLSGTALTTLALNVPGLNSKLAVPSTSVYVGQQKYPYMM